MEKQVIDIEVVVAELPINLEYKEQGYETIVHHPKGDVRIFSIKSIKFEANYAKILGKVILQKPDSEHWLFLNQ